MVMGNLLARRWLFLMDYLPNFPCLAAHERCARSASEADFHHALVDVFLRRNVGLRRPDVRVDNALSWYVARHGRCAWVLRGVRHVTAANLQDRVSFDSRGRDHHSNRRHTSRAGDVAWRIDLLDRHRCGRVGGVDQGK